MSSAFFRIQVALDGVLANFPGSAAARPRYQAGAVDRVDNLRAFGWFEATPVVVLRFEGESPEALARIQDEFRRQLLALDSSLPLPF